MIMKNSNIKLKNEDTKGKDGSGLSFFLYFHLSFSSGFTLIEAVIYLALFSMIAVTLISLAYVSARQDRATTNGVINAYEHV